MHLYRDLCRVDRWNRASRDPAVSVPRCARECPLRLERACCGLRRRRFSFGVFAASHLEAAATGFRTGRLKIQPPRIFLVQEEDHLDDAFASLIAVLPRGRSSGNRFPPSERPLSLRLPLPSDATTLWPGQMARFKLLLHVCSTIEAPIDA